MRRACSAVVASTLLSAAALPVAVFAGLPPASAGVTQAGSPSQAAATASGHQPGSGTVAIMITGMNPQIASLAKKTITISGTVTNRSRQSLVNPKVRLLVSPSPVSDMNTLMNDVKPTDGPLGTSTVPGQATQPATTMAPGSSSSWSITVPVSRLGFRAFGAYPVTVQVSESGTTLASANNFVPYIPPKRGRFASRSPRPQQIAWVLPLIDQPLTGMPGLQQCQSLPAAKLAASMAKGGRLNGLLAAGTTRSAVSDDVTWAVDPALLWDANELSTGRCAVDNPGRAADAKAWLANVKHETASLPMFSTPYANVSLAVVSAGRADDVTNALQDGQGVARQYLGRNLTPEPTGSAASTEAQTAGTLWPPDGVVSAFTLLSFARSGISSVLVSSEVVTGARTASTTDSGYGGQVRILRYNSELSQLLASAPAAPADRFGKEQEFLAATAILAGQPGSQPILAVPPQLWHASGQFVADLLAQTAHAPWLTSVSMATVAEGARPARVGLAKTGSEMPGFSPRVIQRLDGLSRDINQLSSLHAKTNNDLQFALYALESASRRLKRKPLLHMITKLDESVTSQLKGVGLDIKGPIFLGGLKGNVPLIIDNTLDVPVRVRVVASLNQPQGGGFTVQEAHKGLIVVAAKQKYALSLHVQATQAGAATIRLHLVNDRNQPLPGLPVSVTVHATQFGTLAMIILASALGIFVIASATRGLRRRPTEPDNPAEGGHPDPDDAQGGEITAEPDTVVAEHSELDAAGRSGL